MRWSLAFVSAAIITAVCVAPVRAADASGSEALALAALVALPSPSVDDAPKGELGRLLDGDAGFHYTGGPIVVRSAKILCRSSSVDITARTCSLTFGQTTRTLAGRRANELASTLQAAGVSPQGTAGSTFVGVMTLTCTVRPDVVRRRAGGGAACSFLNM